MSDYEEIMRLLQELECRKSATHKNNHTKKKER